MKSIIAALTLTLLPITVGAQQTETKLTEGERCGENAFKMSRSEVIQCLEIQRQEAKEEKARLEAQALELKQKAEELKKAWDDLKKAHSGDPNQQIDGTTGLAKDLNDKGNNDAASKEVIKKSLDFMDRVAHQENQLLDNVGKNIEKISDTPAGSPSTFNSQGHQLVEPKKSSESKLTLDQRIDAQQGGMLASPSTVARVDKADREEQAAEQALREQKAKEAAEQRAALAAAERAARQAQAAAAKAEQDREDAEDAREERRARAQEAAARLAVQNYWAGLNYRPSYTPSQPYVPSYNSSYAPSYVPTEPDGPSGPHNLFDIFKAPTEGPCTIAGVTGTCHVPTAAEMDEEIRQGFIKAAQFGKDGTTESTTPPPSSVPSPAPSSAPAATTN